MMDLKPNSVSQMYHFKVTAPAFGWSRLRIRFAHLHISHFRSIIGRGQGKKDQGYGCHDQSNIIHGWYLYIAFLGDAKKTKITCEPTHKHVAQIPDCEAKAKADDFDDVWAHPYMDRHNEIEAWSSFTINLPKSCKMLPHFITRTGVFPSIRFPSIHIAPPTAAKGSKGGISTPAVEVRNIPVNKPMSRIPTSRIWSMQSN